MAANGCESRASSRLPHTAVHRVHRVRTVHTVPTVQTERQARQTRRQPIRHPAVEAACWLARSTRTPATANQRHATSPINQAAMFGWPFEAWNIRRLEGSNEQGQSDKSIERIARPVAIYMRGANPIIASIKANRIDSVGSRVANLNPNPNPSH